MKKEPQETPAPEESSPEPAQPQDRVAELRDQMLRQKAEFENVKKRLERDKSEAIKYANEGLLVEMLRVSDNFDRAMASLAEGHSAEKVREGLKLAQDDFHRVLERHGVQPVASSVGGEFNPALHEAVAAVETADVPEGTVVDEIQRGYLLNGRLIRPSKVRIAQKKD